MNPLKARVENGRLKLDAPSTLPEGAEVQLLVIDGDELDDRERALLHTSLEEGLDDADSGQAISEQDSLSKLQALRCGSK